MIGFDPGPDRTDRDHLVQMKHRRLSTPDANIEWMVRLCVGTMIANWIGRPHIIFITVIGKLEASVVERPIALYSRSIIRLMSARKSS